MTYKEKLLDPRWQKKRLEVLERDEWTCQYCHDTEDTLHVHHIYYAASRNPWDTLESGLVTYCQCCHSFEEYMKKSYPDFNIIEVVKKKEDTGTYLICLVGSGGKSPTIYYMIFKYQSNYVTQEAMFSFGMFQNMCMMYGKWQALINKFEEPISLTHNG